MPYMQKETYEGGHWKLETQHGTVFLPEAVTGVPDCWPKEPDGTLLSGVTIALDDGPVDGLDEESISDIRATFADYCRGEEDIMSVEYSPTGALYRLNVFGYRDCSDWTPDPASPLFDDLDEGDTLA